MLTHSFSVEVAKVVGDRGAIFLNHFSFWHIQNVAHHRNFHKGRTWTYNTVKAYHDLFPYLSTKEIRTALEKLINNGYLKTDCFNEEPRDRTQWYSLTDKALLLLGISDGHSIPQPADPDHLPKSANGNAQMGKSNLPNGQMELPEAANAIAQSGRPLPVHNNTVNNSFSPPQKKTGENENSEPNGGPTQNLPADSPSSTPDSARAPSSPKSAADLADEDEVERITFIEKLQTSRRIIDTLAITHKIKGQEALDWIESFVTTLWAADDLKRKDPQDLKRHCLSWIVDKHTKQQDREQRNRPRNQTANGSSQAGNGFANSAAKQSGVIVPGSFSRRRQDQGNANPSGERRTIRIDVEPD